MSTSYIVMAGEYSDRHVCGVYTTKKKANAAAKLFDGWVEEFEPDALPDHPVGLLAWGVVMQKDGASRTYRLGVEGVGRHSHGVFADKCTGTTENGQYVFVKEFVVGVWARSEQHAVKIVNEKRAQIIAANEWPADPPPPDQRGFASTGLFNPSIAEIKLGIIDA